MTFETVLGDVLRPCHFLTARAPLDREQVLDAQAEIEQLLAHLRDGRRHVGWDALLVAEELLRDFDGPLFVPGPPGALQSRVRLVRLALG